MKIKKLSIIIPVYNEKKTIQLILDKIEKSRIRQDIEKEIIIVDDGSTDGTREILKSYIGKYRVVLQEKNLGKGAAVRAGFALASGDYIIVQDADLEYDPNEIQSLIEKAEKTGVKIIFGSRVLGRDKREETPGIFYYLGGHFLSWLANFLYGTRITDEPTCYKMFARKVLNDIKLECVGFEFCPEITAKVAKAGYEIVEVSISYKTRTKKEGKKIRLFKDGAMAIWTLLKYRFNDKQASLGFLNLYKKWFWLLLVFLLIRVILFSSLWAASPNGWENFYAEAQSAPNTLTANWHEPCDWHPPLYYFFTTIFLKLFKTVWVIYFFQIILAWFGAYLIYRIAKTIFSEKVAFAAAAIAALEPYSAWHNFLLTAENLTAIFLLSGIYFVLKYFNKNNTIILVYAALFFGLATLTRLNTLYLPQALSLGILLIYFLRNPLKLPYFSNLKLKHLIFTILIFNVAYFMVLFPWQLRNKIVYGKYTVANMLFTNVFHYNYPTALFIRDNISYSEAQKVIAIKTEADLGANVGDQGSCNIFTKEELVKQFDYYRNESSKYIKDNFWQYTRMHLVRTAPFFLDSGYLNLIKAYTGVYDKPDITGSLMTGNYQALIIFLKNINFSLFAYLFGLVFWGLCSLLVFGGIVYTYYKDRNKLLFFLLSAGVVIYTALLCSPFVLARYRLPVYFFFLVPLTYIIGEIFKMLKMKKIIKKIIINTPIISSIIKKRYDEKQEKDLQRQVSNFFSLAELPYMKIAPNKYGVGHEPTIRCNLRCKMCYQADTRALRRSELETEQIISMYGKFEGRVKSIKLVGGEPLLRSDIFALLNYLDQRGIKITLQSNCTLIDEKMMDKLAEYKNLNNIIASLDGPEPIHDAIRGVPGTFTRLTKALSLIHAKRPDINITIFGMMLFNDGVNNLYGLIDTAKSMGIDSLNLLFEQVYCRQNVDNAKKILMQKMGWIPESYQINTQIREPEFITDFDVIELKNNLDKIRKYGIKKKCYINFTPYNFYLNLDKYLKQKPVQVFCTKLLSPQLRINQKGDVIWCDTIEKSFGNLIEKTPDEIWLSEDYQKFRKFLFEHSLPICTRCCKAIYIK